MGKKKEKKNGNEKHLANVLLITATINLIQAIVELINKLLEGGTGERNLPCKEKIYFFFFIVNRRRENYVVEYM